MGILNTTPDSFSDGGRHNSLASALQHAELMADAGADIIDIGGESTRPGADEVDETTEAERTLVTTARIVVLPFLILMVLFQKASQSFTARKR